MNVALVSEWNCDTPADWSGTPYYMARAFRDVLGPVHVISHPPFSRLAGTVDQRLRTIGAYVTARLAEEDVDVAVFQGTAALPYCSAACRRIVWHDSTWFGLMTQRGVNLSRFQANWPALSQWDIATLDAADHVFFASPWACALAKEYGSVRATIDTLPFGANLDDAFTAAEARATTDHVRRRTCRALFVGKDWRRKGLRKAIDTVTEMNRLDQPTTISVIGPPKEALPANSPYVNYLGTIDKSLTEHRELYKRVLGESDLLIHPASFECFGIAILEANLYGVPALATPVGGLPFVIEDGVTGCLISPERYPTEAAILAVDLFGDVGRLRAMAQTASRRVRDRLNWHALVRELCERTHLRRA